MPYTTAFLFLTGMCVGGWVCILSIAASDKREVAFYTAMVVLMGIVYTLGNVTLLVNKASEIS